MLKVEPRFKLDRPFRGPYRVHTVTSTCAHIKLINQPDAELITVSLQRLSRCRSQDISGVQPWVGHGRTRKRRQLRKPLSSESVTTTTCSTASSEDSLQQVKCTRRGRTITRPARYCRTNQLPQGSACQPEGGCKVAAELRDHVRGSPEERREEPR